MDLRELKDAIDQFSESEDRMPDDLIDDLVELHEFVGMLIELHGGAV